MDIVYAVVAALSAVGAILAWVAKLKWSSEHDAATKQVIAAKDSTIESLRAQLTAERELNPVRIREYFLAVKQQLEEYNEELRSDLSKANLIIATKSERIAELEATGNATAQLITELEQETSAVRATATSLQRELNSIEAIEEAAGPLLNEYSTMLNAVFALVDHISVGETMRIVDGPFRGITGTVRAKRGPRRVLLGIESIGPDFEVDIDAASLISTELIQGSEHPPNQEHGGPRGGQNDA